MTISKEKKSCCAKKQDDTAAAVEEPQRTPFFMHLIKETASKYASVIGVFGLAIAGASAMTIAQDSGLMGWMHNAMGLTMLNFALLKMGDIGKFATAFAQYDLLAAKSDTYGRAYPFIEAGLGLGFLMAAAFSPEQQAALYSATIALSVIGGAGVAKALWVDKKDNLTCACVGGDKNLPLSTMAVAEYTATGGMAAIMLAQLIL